MCTARYIDEGVPLESRTAMLEMYHVLGLGSLWIVVWHDILWKYTFVYIHTNHHAAKIHWLIIRLYIKVYQLL